MSISDTLFDAEEAIKEYLKNDMISGWVANVEGTPELRAKVESLLLAMKELREELDEPPEGVFPEIEKGKSLIEEGKGLIKEGRIIKERGEERRVYARVIDDGKKTPDPARLRSNHRGRKKVTRPRPAARLPRAFARLSGF
jgi:hypothetical protein